MRAARHVADELTSGGYAFMPDLDHTRLLVTLGANPFEAGQWARSLDHAITDAKACGMRLMTVEPRFSHTAAPQLVLTSGVVRMCSYWPPTTWRRCTLNQPRSSVHTRWLR